MLFVAASLIPLFFVSFVLYAAEAIECYREVAEYFFSCERGLLALLNGILSAICLIAGCIGIRFIEKKEDIAGPPSLEVVCLKGRNDQALTFFLTVIIPMVSIGMMNDVQGALCFWLSVGMLIVLIARTETCFDNPVLVMMGFYLYEASLTTLGGGGDSVTRFIITRSKLSENTRVSAIKLSNRYWYIRKVSNENVVV